MGLQGQGIQLPVSLYIKNLGDIASQLKQFSDKHILADSFGGKKVNTELQGILRTLGQIETKANNAFHTDADFTSVQKDINKIELGFQHIAETISGLKMKDISIPPDQLKQLTIYQETLKSLRADFENAQRLNILNTDGLAGNLEKAFGAGSARIIKKNYEDMRKAVADGVKNLEAELMAAKLAYERSNEVITQNPGRQKNFTAWGALDYLTEAFKKLPKDKSKYSEQQRMMAEYMNIDETTGSFTTFKGGFKGANSFWQRFAEVNGLTDEGLQEIRKRTTEWAKAAGIKASEVLQRAVTDKDYGARLFTGKNMTYTQLAAEGAQYNADIKARDAAGAKIDPLEGRTQAMKAALETLQSYQSQYNAALNTFNSSDSVSATQEKLSALTASLRNAATQAPELSQMFGQAAERIGAFGKAIAEGQQRLANLDKAFNRLQSISNFITRYMGAYAIVRKISTAVRNAFNNIKELDKSITNIAVVTNMSQQDLWGKIGEYTQMAQQYGVATKDVYTVSQIFYQQGLQTNQVMSLTTETLKMAKISGMDYSSAANAMTVAIRAFKIEMTEAQSVTDTYSALAAKFAVSSAEIANAMEKTASSAANVGMSLQSTSAFMSVMIQTTRESAQNIGSAMKSIISRYGEMKASPETLLNVDGEEAAFNKTDTALKSIGISIKDASGQFRDFDDVIMELAAKWDTLDNNTQRYIATVMAGNRQQSRFIALVSNYDELKRAMQVANDSENASIVQVGKTMDSLETKAQKLQNAFAQIYLDLHLEEGLKGLYDGLTRILRTIGKLGMLKGVIPTLLNLFGAGRGLVQTLSSTKDFIQKRKAGEEKELGINMERAKAEVAEFQKQLEQPANKDLNVNVHKEQIDELESQVGRLQSQMDMNVSVNGGTTPVGPTAAPNEFYTSLYQAYQKGDLNTPEGRASILNNWGITSANQQYSNMDAMLMSMQTATPQETSGLVADLAVTFTQAQMSVQELSTAMSTASADIQQSAAQIQSDITNAGQTQMQASTEFASNVSIAAGAIRGLLPAADETALALMKLNVPIWMLGMTIEQALKCIASGDAAALGSFGQNYLAPALNGAAAAGFMPSNRLPASNDTTIIANNGTQVLISSNQGVNGETSYGAKNPVVPLRDNIPDRSLRPTSNEKASWSKNTWGTGKARAGVMAGTVAARLIGTAITAAGAAHQDKSSDIFEGSKIYTGIGNSLSGAGTGASIGMAFGPWGAAIGALVGAMSGLPAIFDGLIKTSEENIQLLQEEAQNKKDESLKDQSKELDLKSSIENITNLRKAMYNSTEDMEAYKEAMNNLAENYPQLVSSYDSAGDAIIDLVAAEAELNAIRATSAASAREAAVAEAKLASAKAAESYNLQQYEDYSNGYEDQYYVYGANGKNGYYLKYNAHDKKNLENMLAYTASDNDEVRAIIENQKQNGGYLTNTELRTLWNYFSQKSGFWENEYERASFGNFVSGSVDLESNARTIPGYQGHGMGKSLDVQVEEFVKYLTNNKSTYGIEDPYAYFGWTKGNVSKDQYDTAVRIMSDKRKQLYNAYKNATNSAVRTYADESLINTLNGTDLSESRISAIQDKGIFSQMIAIGLRKAVEDSEYSDILAWEEKDSAGLSTVRSDLANAVVEWTNLLTDTELESLSNINEEMINSLSPEALMKKYHIKDGTPLAEYFYQSYIDANQANRDRILKTIYSTDQNGKITENFNEDLKGIDSLTGGKDTAQTIANYFKNETPKIISKYADWFTNQFVQINSLAEDGYTKLAERRLTTLQGLADKLQALSAEDQSEIFGIITNIDFSSYESISDAYELIQEYGKKNNKVDELDPILQKLEQAQNNLLFNVSTLAQEIIGKIKTITKNTETILTSNKSGLTLDKALEEFTTLQSKFTDIKFDEVFKYDAILGKYVYTQDGLMKSLEQQRGQMADEYQELKDTNQVYQRFKNRVETTNPQNMPTDTEMEDHGELLTWVQRTYGIYGDDTYLQSLIEDFYDDQSIKVHSQAELIKYIKSRASESNDEYEQGKAVYDAFLKENKNNIYASIDWGKLALGTDVSKTNENSMLLLAQEMGLYDIEKGEWAEDVAEENRGWQGVLNEYLKALYTDENGVVDEAGLRAATLAASGQIKKSQQQQISTAISEILAGEGQVLSDTTLALANEFNLQVSNEGVLSAGNDFIVSAQNLYNKYQESLLTLADKNQAYASIITKSFEKPNQVISTLSSGASLDVGALETTFTTFGLKLSDYYNAVANEWLTRNGRDWSTILSTDAFGNTQIKNWQSFLGAIKAENPTLNWSKIQNSFEYKNAYSSYVDGLITLDTQASNLISKQFNDAFSSIVEFKELNVSQMRSSDAWALTFNNAGTLENGILKITDVVQYANNAVKLFSQFANLSAQELYDRTGWTSIDLAKNWKAAQTVLTQSSDAWTSISGNLTAITTDNISSLIEKGGFNINDLEKDFFQKVGDHYVLSLGQYYQYLINSFGATSFDQLDSNQQLQVTNAYNAAAQAIISKITGLDWTKVLNGSATQAEQQEFISGLGESLLSLGISINEFYSDGILDITALKKKLRSSGLGDIADQIINSIESNISEMWDTAIDEMSTANTLFTEGATSQSEIRKFVQRYNQISGKAPVGIGDLFAYDTLTQTYTLTRAGLKSYKDAQTQLLQQAGMSNTEIARYFDQQAQSIEMDIAGFLSGENIGAEGINAKTLISAIQNWYILSNERVQHTIENQARAWAAENKVNEKGADLISDYVLNILRQGGKVAVDTLKMLKGENVTSEDIQAVYRAEVNRLNAALEQVPELTVGSIITGDLIDILSGLDGFNVSYLGDGTAVVNTMGDVVQVYLSIYKQMQSAGEATTAELNSVFAQVLTARDQGNIDAISALGDAMNMSYDSLGSLLAQYGKGVWKNLEFAMQHQVWAGIESLGDGTVRIVDWERFSRHMNWEVGGEAYTAAYNAYNDSLIELDHKVGKQVTEEIKSIGEAKLGDRINVTYLVESLDMTEAEINAALLGMGAQIRHGILTINDTSKIPQVIATLTRMVSESGTLLASEMAELADTIEEYIDSIIGLIKNALGGTLKHSEANTLQEWADAMNIGKLDFTKTAEGLQISWQSAMKLYNALKLVDGIKAKVVFDELSSSLKENNENYSSVSAIMARIATLEKEIQKANGKTSDARIQQYEQELALAKEILAVRSTSEDESFNFMSNKIPGAQNNPLNYYSNWNTAFTKIREAFKVKKGGKKGFIDYEDWYNIVTEMGNLAALGGPIEIAGYELDGSLEKTSALIQAGADSLTAIDTGEIKVNLGAIGTGISSGADLMTDGISDGIKNMAKSQVKMLDGLIAMLELIVSMEELGDIDVDGNGIDFNELFAINADGTPDFTQYNSVFDAWREKMIEYYTDYMEKGDESEYADIAKGMEGILLGDYRFIDLISMDPNELKTKVDGQTQQLFAQVMTAFVSAAQSGHFDLNDLYSSINQVIKESGFDGTIPLTIGDMTLLISGNGITSVDWTNTSTKNILAAAAKEYKMDQADMQKEFTQWLVGFDAGTITGTKEVKYVMAIKGNVTLDNDGKITSVTVNGKTYTNNSNIDMDAAFMASVAQAQGGILSEEWWNEEYIIRDDKGKVIGYKSKVQIGNAEIEATYTEGEGQKIIGTDGTKYDSIDDFLDGEYDNYLNNSQGHGATKEQWKWIKYRIPTQIEPQFTINEKVTDFSSSGDLQTKVKGLMQGGRAAVEKLITKQSDNGDGTYTVDLGDHLKFTFTGGENPVDALYEYFGNLIGIDTKMSETISTALSNSFQSTTITDSIASAVSQGIQQAFGPEGIPIEKITITPTNVELADDTIKLTKEITEATGKVTTLKLTATNTEAEGALDDAKIELDLKNQEVEVKVNKDDAIEKIKAIAQEAKKLDQINPVIVVSPDDQASGVIESIRQAVTDLCNSSYTLTIAANFTSGNGSAKGDVSETIKNIKNRKFGENRELTSATGNAGNAKAQGTLMGELGPELVVSNGRYFVAGQNGAEFVNLADDAIVFNHLQTQSLFKNGMSRSRGAAITNERNAVSFAHGNVAGGPAMASAAAALAALKTLRAQWKALADLSAKDLAGKGGGGGGGGGGNLAAFIKQLERWYNWLQQIATLEKEITYEQQKRQKITSDFVRSGQEYYNSQRKTLKDLQEQINVYEDLSREQKAFFEERRTQLNQQSAFSSLYTFDEYGQIKYDTDRFVELSKRFGADEKTGKPNYTVQQQYDWLISQGYGYAMEYNKSGEKIDTKDDAGLKSAIEAFWDKIENDKQEMQELRDAIDEHAKTILEKQEAQNEILHEIEDNQISLENKVMKAIEDAAKRQIQELQDTKDALQKSNEALIRGLSDQLQKEQELYQNQQSEADLATKQRRLSILERSGGSASEINALQAEIDDSTRELYFAKQQEQIDAIQTASENQLEKLQQQIDLMNESLEYQKLHGLLWEQVYEVMSRNPTDIANFIAQNDSAYWGKSPADMAKSMRDDLFEAEKWKAFAQEGVDIKDYIAKIANEIVKTPSADDDSSNESGKNNGANSGNANNGSGNGTGSSGGGKPPKTPKYTHWVVEYEDENGRINKIGTTYNTEAEAKQVASKNSKKKAYVVGYDIGGIVDETGPALLHAKESVLTAQQTSLLRNEILGNSPNSLMNLLLDFKDAYSGISSTDYSTINKNFGSAIENATVNMNVAQISNDYDARRAGEQALSEMMRIARKTSVQNRIGR